jgi:hypothetical protein
MGNDKRVRELDAATGILGSHYVPVDAGSGTLKRATINEAVAASNARRNIFNALDYGLEASPVAGIQNAYNAAFASSTGGTVEIPAGTWDIAGGLNFSQAGGQNLNKHVRIVGNNSQGTVLRFNTTGVCIDAVSADNIRFENLQITNVTNTPTVGILLGRTAAALNCRWLSARNVRIEGSFSQACVASVAAEIQHWDTCIFLNTHATGVAYYSSTQPIGIRADGAGGYTTFTVASANGTLATSSNTDITFTKCAFLSGGAYGIPLSIEAGMQASFYGCEFDPYGANAQACVLISAELNNIFAGPLLFSGCLFESEDADGIVLYAASGTNKDFRSIKVENNYFNLYGSGQYALTWAGGLSNVAVGYRNGSYRGNGWPTINNDIIRVNYVEGSDIDMALGTIVWAANGTSAATRIDSSVKAYTHSYASGADVASQTRCRVEAFATAEPTTGGWVKGDVIWNSSPDEGEAVGWLCHYSGGAYSVMRADTTSYAIGTWLLMNASPYSVWEVTGGTGNTGGSTPSQSGAVGSTVSDGDLTLTKRAGGPAYFSPFGQAKYRSGSATPAGSVTPNFVGEEYLDSTAVKWYKSTGLTNTDWVALN